MAGRVPLFEFLLRAQFLSDPVERFQQHFQFGDPGCGLCRFAIEIVGFLVLFVRLVAESGRFLFRIPQVVLEVFEVALTGQARVALFVEFIEPGPRR